MGSIDRLIGIWKANLNELLNQMEDPEKMVHQLIRDMEDSVDRTTAAVATAVANQRRLERDCQKRQAQVEEYRAQAEQAVAAGDEQAARQALERKVLVARQADDLRQALEESKQATAHLREELEQLRATLHQAQARQGALIARHRAARLRRQWGGGTGEEILAAFQQLEQRLATGPDDFERLEQRVEAAEAEAEIRRELAGEAQAERRQREQERQARVEEELQALRRKLNKDSTT